MATVVPESAWPTGEQDLARDLGEALAALLEFTGAGAGWVGFTQADGRLVFPVRHGNIAETWLTLQQGRAGVWGFAAGEGPTLLNDLPPLHALGEPALSNLLSCSLMRNGAPCGQVVAANKLNGFNSHDAAVLQALAHWMSYRLARGNEKPVEVRPVSTDLPCDVLNRIDEGVFVGDETGRLIWANSVWLNWTGFTLEQLVGQVAPYPFWISHRDLALLRQQSEMPSGLVNEGSLPASRPLPFRRNDNTVFWCHLDTVIEELAGKRFILALLRPATIAARPAPQSAPTDRTAASGPAFALPADLPFAAALTDQTGRIVWANELFFQQIAPAPVALGAMLHERFTGVSAGALRRLAGETETARIGRVGRLLVHRVGGGASHPLIAYWSTLSLRDGVGFFFGFSADWAALGLPDDVAVPHAPQCQQPGCDSLALLLTPGREVAFWDERWHNRTGLTDRELAGVPTEVVLDWLLPRQRDRDRVTDLMHRPNPLSGQFVLDLQTPGGSRPFLCTFLPVSQPGGRRWLLLASDLFSPTSSEAAPFALIRAFLRGLRHLLHHYALISQTFAETALKCGNLPPDAAAPLQRTLDNGQGIGRLLVALQDLAAAQPPATEEISIPHLVRGFLEEQRVGKDHGIDELDVDLPGNGFVVRVNRRMIKTVLHHLFLNARQALVPNRQGRIHVRVFAHADAVGCSITDNGEGLPTDDWVQLLAPFASTKGPFARDSRHAAIDAAGLGLTVSRHLLALHGGRLELRAFPDAGTSAVFFLPRADCAEPLPESPSAS
ncbi:MAG TPA: ATP-binding protein [Gemmataceae bacterium]|jgi:signal transduction histidine kinase